ncbi:amidase domain-containing protein [Salinibacterium sp. NG22]|uniref:amidase domain-containing protein n=1 Tax=Salinibacterium sp. NG22 TaxID=2792040 RepID=UPI0018CD7F75|nr:amidase domain-containing protein [Salinibacterium sp. NG22]MBH0109995.1 amidase domain-containing protein [Salinibacterium sp. NG22]
MSSPYLVRRIGVGAAALGVVAAITAFVIMASPVAETASSAAEDVAAAVAETPEVHAVSATSGTLVGGESITITGAALDDVTDVTFGGVAATDVVVTDSGTLTATVPSAVDFQPTTVAIEVVADTVPVAAAAALDYTYEASTPVDNQMQYLMEHWEDYNVDEYGDLNSVGGDCANFASQSLLMRGWTMTADWFNYDAAADWSGAWGYVPTMENWLISNPELGATQLSFDERDQVKVGDLVVFDWNDNDFLDHIQVVSSVETVDGEIVIKMVGHNLDTNYRDLDETITVDHPGATGHFWSIP